MFTHHFLQHFQHFLKKFRYKIKYLDNPYRYKKYLYIFLSNFYAWTFAVDWFFLFWIIKKLLTAACCPRLIPVAVVKRIQFGEVANGILHSVWARNLKEFSPVYAWIRNFFSRERVKKDLAKYKHCNDEERPAVATMKMTIDVAILSHPNINIEPSPDCIS